MNKIMQKIKQFTKNILKNDVSEKKKTGTRDIDKESIRRFENEGGAILKKQGEVAYEKGKKTNKK